MIEFSWQNVISVFLTIISIAFLFFGRHLLVEEHYIPKEKKRHSWKSIKILNRTCYCSLCEIMMFSSTGKFCENCGICSDPACLNKGDRLLKCKDKVIKDVKEQPHLWVKGNLPLNCDCFICLGDIDYHTGPGLYGYRCCWCQRTVHNECFVEGSQLKVCDYGPFADMIMPPTSLTLSKIRGTKRLNVVKITAPNLDTWKPLFVIANTKSGGNTASEVVALFRGILHPLQVMELSSRGPQEALQWIVKTSPIASRIIVAGGDGTVGWILTTIFKMDIKPVPEVAILPIGTGNDLSRVMKWGSEISTPFNPIDILTLIGRAETVQLDRWLLDIHGPMTRNPLKWLPHRLIYMYNYFSVGVDAQVTLNFHKARESPFYMFSNRIFNKVLYLCFGTHQVVIPDCEGLERKIELYMDDKKIDLPELQSIVCLNIDSWGAGVHLWEMGEESDDTQEFHSISDGIIEVLGIVSSFHIAQLQVGLSKPIRLGQAKSVKINMLEDCPVQVDGEPWIQHPCSISVSLKGQSKMLKCST